MKFIFEVFGRIVLPAVFPFREKHVLRLFEKSIFIVFGYLCFLPAVLVERVMKQASKAFLPKTNDVRMAEAEEAIKTMIDVGEKEGLFKEEEGELLHSIVEFSETIVREVMTPRIDLQCLEISQPAEKFLELVVQSGYSKIPAYK